MKSSASTEKTSETTVENISFQTSKNSSVKLYDYGNILLRTYIEIATKGDFSLLIISGTPSAEELIQRWESIVRQNSKGNGDHRYDAYFELLKGYGEITGAYTITSIQLEILFYKIDWKIIEEVRQAGYKIETDSSEVYAKSIHAARRKIANLITRSEMKRKEIERQFGGKQEDVGAQTYEEIIGMLELALDRTIMDAETLTLAKYNVLKKGVEDRRKAHERANKRK